MIALDRILLYEENLTWISKKEKEKREKETNTLGKAIQHSYDNFAYVTNQQTTNDVSC